MEDSKLELARAKGYEGEYAEAFATCLTGETPEELSASADRVAGLLDSLKPQPVAYPRGYDGSAGRGLEAPTVDPNAEFADFINQAFRR
ncbi:MAG: hypothetical protein BGP03_10220 [Pseudonocardia sp. 73-21]|nr:MAG: hypothetical protein BGP03_10220 [Pseudonocardia sp. 73-21]